MTDEELRQLFASLATSIRETNHSIKEVNVRLAYTEGDVQADRERTRRLEEALAVLKELALNMDERLDSTLAQQHASERRLDATLAQQQVSERRLDATLAQQQASESRLDAALAQQQASERRLELLEGRQEKSDSRQDRAESRQDKLDEALASLARTVERYINARNTNGDNPNK